MKFVGLPRRKLNNLHIIQNPAIRGSICIGLVRLKHACIATPWLATPDYLRAYTFDPQPPEKLGLVGPQ